MAEEIKTEQEDVTQGLGGDVIKALQDKLLSTTGVVSSEPSQLESFVTEEIETVRLAGEKRETGIETKFERERIERKAAGARRFMSAQDARRGFATNTALFRQIEEQTEKSLRDLDLREQEALAVGAIEEATSIRQLKIAELQFRQQSQQQAFANLLSIANFSIQNTGINLEKARLELGIKSEARLERESLASLKLARDRFELEKEKVGKDDFISVFDIIALKRLGVDVEFGDTLSSIDKNQLDDLDLGVDLSPSEQRLREQNVVRANTDLSSDALDTKTPFGDALLGDGGIGDVGNKHTLEELFQIAVNSGASIPGFIAALRTSDEIDFQDLGDGVIQVSDKDVLGDDILGTIDTKTGKVINST